MASDKPPIEPVRAIAFYAGQNLERMDFEAERLNESERKIATWYKRGHLEVHITVQWYGEIPEGPMPY